MKQIEKLDLVLRCLYEKPNKSGEIGQLLKEKGVDVTLDDAHILGRRLADAGFVRFYPTRDSALVDMKSEGIEFVEGDSYTHRGHPIITNTYNNTIVNSPNASLINESSNINIVQNTGSIQQIIAQIKEEFNNDSTISPEKKQGFVDCLQEVEDGVANGKVPKYAFKAFTEFASDFASVGGLIIQLGQLLGLLTPLT